MANDLYTQNGKDAVDTLRTQKPHTLPRASVRVDGEVELVCETPHPQQASGFRDAMKRLFGNYNSDNKVWLVHLDPKLYGETLCTDILQTLCDAGIVKSVLPAMPTPSIINCDLGSFDDRDKVILDTKYEERLDILQHIPRVKWDSVHSRWGVTVGDLKSGDFRVLKYIDERHWFKGVRKESASHYPLLSATFSHTKLKTPLAKKTHFIRNGDLYHIVTTLEKNPEIVYSTLYRLPSEKSTHMIKAPRQVFSASARMVWNRATSIGADTKMPSEIAANYMRVVELINDMIDQAVNGLTPYASTHNYAFQA